MGCFRVESGSFCKPSGHRTQLDTTGPGEPRGRFRTPPLPFLRKLLTDVGGRDFDVRTLWALSGHKVEDAYSISGSESQHLHAVPIVALLRVNSEGARFGLGGCFGASLREMLN